MTLSYQVWEKGSCGSGSQSTYRTQSRVLDAATELDGVELEVFKWAALSK